MKVVCESCHAAYAIDGAMIPPRGARAQCPRCGHQQRVMPDASAAAAPQAPAPPPLWEPPPVEKPPAAPAPEPERCQVCGKVLTDAFDKALGICDSCRNKESDAGASALPPTPAPSPSGPRPVSPATSGARPAAAPPRAAQPSTPGGPPGAPARPAPQLDLEVSAEERLDMAFEAALAESRAAQAAAAAPPQAPPPEPLELDRPAAPPPDAPPGSGPRPTASPTPPPGVGGPRSSITMNGPRPTVPGAQGPAVSGPRSSITMNGPRPTVPGAQEAAPGAPRSSITMNGPRPTVPGAQDTAPGAPRSSVTMNGPRPTVPGQAPAPGAPRSSVTLNAQRPAVVAAAQTRRRRLPFIAGGAVLLLVVLGVAGYLLRDRLLSSTPMTHSSALPEAINAVLPRWRLSFVDLTGTSAEYVTQGRGKLAEDSLPSYREAEELFQKALVLDPGSDDAVAGYVQALALGRGELMDDETYREALGLVNAAEERSKGRADVLVAKANLLLTRDAREQVVEARGVAQQALVRAKGPDVAQAELVVGLAFLSTSATLAIQHFDEALKAEPPPKRAYYYRGRAHELAGEYRLAIQDLQKRLSLDPDQSEAVGALARIYEEVGEVGQAKALYQKALASHPDDLRSAVTLAAISYQLEGRAKEAAAEIRALLKQNATAPQEARAEAWVHLAAAERLAGNLDGAAAAVDQALKIPGARRAAHLQLFLLSLQRGKLDQAAKSYAQLSGPAIAPALLKLLEGRLRFAQGQDDEAQARFTEAVRLDARRVDALIYSGVAAVRGGHAEQGWQTLTQAMQADPTRLGPRPALTLYFLQPNDTLEGAQGHLPKLARDPSEPMPLLSEGLIRYHLRDYAVADKLISQALDVSDTNALAHVYRTLIALQRGDRKAALASGERAAATGRQLAVAHYAYGVALAANDQQDVAQKELRQALELSPGLLAAEFSLGELEAKANPASARARMLRVTGLDPSYLPAKRALFALDR